ncbi:hypothetical protein LTR95_005218 [Oleoguttula sp. CCFEE 5521]
MGDHPPNPPNTPITAEELRTIQEAQQSIEAMKTNALLHEANAKLYGKDLDKAHTALKEAETALKETETKLGKAFPAEESALHKQIASIKESIKKATETVDRYQAHIESEMREISRLTELQERTRANIDDLKSMRSPGQATEEVNHLVDTLKTKDADIAEMQTRIQNSLKHRNQMNTDFEKLESLDAAERSKLDMLTKDKDARVGPETDAKIETSKANRVNYLDEMKMLDDIRTLDNLAAEQDTVRLVDLQNERLTSLQRLEVFDMNEAAQHPFRSGDSVATPAEEIGLSRPATPQQAPAQAGRNVHSVTDADVQQHLGSHDGRIQIPTTDGSADEVAVDLFKNGKATEAAAKPVSDIFKAGANGIKIGAVSNEVKGAVRFGRTVVQPAKAITTEASEAIGKAVAGELAGEVGGEVAATVGAGVAGTVAAEAVAEAGVVVLGETSAAATAEILASAAARGAGVAVGVMVRGAFELVAGPIGMAIGVARMAEDLMYHTIKAKVMEHHCHDKLNKDYKTEVQRVCRRPPASVPTRLEMWKADAFKCDKLWTEKDYHKMKLKDERGAQDLKDDHRFVNTHYIVPGQKPCDFGWYAKRDLDAIYVPHNVTLILADGTYHLLL